MKEYYSPNEFNSGSDSDRIQAAIDKAAETQVGKVVIPKYNELKDCMLWTIDKTIRIPSDMTIILDNSHLIMADGVMCKMFENSSFSLPSEKNLDGEQKNINILGVGNAVLDGGNHNGLTERTANKDGLPTVRENLTIGFSNVSDFRIDNLTIIDQRYWAIALMFSRRGTISNMRFKLQRRIRGDWRVWRNQDGIDLRSGCNNILIENIMGETGDDCIALTDLMNEKSPEYNHKVEGKSSDIHDVIIRNVRCITNMCNVIRLLNQYEHKIYNITMDNIIDAGTPGLESIAQSVIALGDDAYYRDEKDRAKKGSMYNISINNVYSRSMTAVHLEMTVKNIHINNVFVHSDGQYAVTFGKWGLKDSIFFFAPDLYEEQSNLSLIPKKDTTTLTAENVLIENIYYTAKSTAENFTPAICAVHNSELENVTVRNISCGDDVKLLHTTSDSDNIYGLTISK